MSDISIYLLSSVFAVYISETSVCIFLSVFAVHIFETSVHFPSFVLAATSFRLLYMC